MWRRKVNNNEDKRKNNEEVPYVYKRSLGRGILSLMVIVFLCMMIASLCF